MSIKIFLIPNLRRLNILSKTIAGSSCLKKHEGLRKKKVVGRKILGGVLKLTYLFTNAPAAYELPSLCLSASLSIFIILTNARKSRNNADGKPGKKKPFYKNL